MTGRDKPVPYDVDQTNAAWAAGRDKPVPYDVDQTNAAWAAGRDKPVPYDVGQPNAAWTGRRMGNYEASINRNRTPQTFTSSSDT